MPFWSSKKSKNNDDDMPKFDGLDEDIDIDNVDEAGLADELAALQAGTHPGKKAPKAHPTKVRMPDAAAIDALVSDDLDDDAVVLTDADMNDPELLGELGDLLGGGGDDDDDDADDDVATPDGGPAVHEAAAEAARKSKEQERTAWLSETETKIEDAKMRALQFKRAGNQQAALVALREAKMLLAQKKQFLEVPGSAAASPAAAGAADTKPTPAPRKPAPTATPVAPPVAVVAAVAESPPAPVSAGPMVLRRYKEYRVAALKFKKAGDMAMAKQLLAISKRMQSLVEQAQIGVHIDPAQVPPPPPQPGGDAGAAGAAVGRVAAMQAAAAQNAPHRGSLSSDIRQDMRSELGGRGSSASNTSVDSVWHNVMNMLEEQVEVCHSHAKRHYDLGEKDKAVEFFRQKKRFQQDLDMVRAEFVRGGSPPRFRYEVRDFSYVQSFPALHDTQLELHVARCINLPVPSGYKPTDVSPYLVCSLGFPDSDSPQSLTTSCFEGGVNPAVGVTHTFDVDRKARAFQRFVKRHHVQIEVWHARGLLRHDKLLGRAQVKLAAFEEKCEVAEAAELVDERRKATGGKIEVRLRMREPLGQPQEVKVTERWLVLEGFEAPAAATDAAPSPSSRVQTPAGSASPGAGKAPAAASSRGRSSPPSSTLKTPAAAGGGAARSRSPSPNPAAAAGADDDEEEEDPNTIDNAVSNNVLEYEIECCDKAIAQARARHQPTDELDDRKMQATVKMTVLVAQVQSGQLTLEAYLARVKERMHLDKRLALQCKKDGKMKWAAAALKRYHIQKQEVDEVEAAGGEV